MAIIEATITKIIPSVGDCKITIGWGLRNARINKYEELMNATRATIVTILTERTVTINGNMQANGLAMLPNVKLR